MFFIPMRRYTLPSALPFHLEPYRPIIAFILAAWVLALLMATVQFRRTSLTTPILLFGVAALASLATNPSRLAGETYKSLFLFSTFFVTYFLVVSVVRSREAVAFVVKVMVVFGSLLALFAVIESRTGFSPFVGLDTYVPVLNALPVDLTAERGGRFRAFASAEHPIALATLLTMLVPFAVYLAVVTKKFWWWLLSALLIVGTVSTVSRTATLTLAAGLAVFAVVRWSDVRRLWILVFPLVAIVHILLPGTLGTLRSAFQPPGGLIAEQQTYADSRSTAGRVADIAPSVDEFQEHPLLGSGLATRITTGPNANARLLDNQWLGLLLETGVLGVGAFVLLLVRFVRRQIRLARDDPGPTAYLPLACAAATVAYAVGMFTYDSFSFTQTTFVFFLVLAIGSSYELVAPEPRARAVRRAVAISRGQPAYPRPT